MIFLKKSFIIKTTFRLLAILLLVFIYLLPLSKLQQHAQADENVTFTEFALPIANSKPLGITAGPDGNIWFTEGDGASTTMANDIGRITPTGTITKFPIPS